jgi:hypothetical protein
MYLPSYLSQDPASTMSCAFLLYLFLLSHHLFLPVSICYLFPLCSFLLCQRISIPSQRFLNSQIPTFTALLFLYLRTFRNVEICGFAICGQYIFCDLQIYDYFLQIHNFSRADMSLKYFQTFGFWEQHDIS